MGEDVIVMGWGLTTDGGSSSDVLLEVTVPVVTDAACDAVYGGITDQMI